jgi:hypothetical protein
MITSEVGNREALQAQPPRREQVKGTVPRKIIEAAGGFKKRDGARLFGFGRKHAHPQGHQSDAGIIKMTRQAALDVLNKELVH